MDDSHAGGISPTVSPKLRRCASSSIVELQKRREEIASFDADRVTTSKELQQASAKLGELTSRTNPLYTTQNGQSGPHTQEPLQSAVWKTGIWTRLPVFAALSLLGVLACTAAAAVILVVSDGANVQGWGNVTPSVYLAILSAIANSLLSFALSQGLAVVFWRTALNCCSLSELDRIWQCGTSLKQAITQGFRRSGKILALAQLMTFVSLFRSPLYQRSSSVQTGHTEQTQGNITLHVAQTLPEEYGGISLYSRATVQETTGLSPVFIEIMNEYSAHSSIILEHEGCGNKCTTTVKGFGFKAECSKHNQTFPQDSSGGSYSQNFFESSVALYKTADWYTDFEYYAALQLNATFNVEQKFSTDHATTTYTLTSHVCNLTGGLVEYTVHLAGNVVSLSDRSEDTFLQPFDLLSPGDDQTYSLIGGFQYAGDYLFSSSADFLWAGAVSSTSLSGSLSNQMVKSSSESSFDLFISGDMAFNDPMDLMIDTMRDVAFRASVKAGKENATITNARQTVPYTGSAVSSIYRTDYWFLGVAIVISLLGVISVGAAYNGWWQLGRDMSMSPLEIAKAFDAPLLVGTGSNVPGGQLPPYLRDYEVRYGAAPIQQEIGISVEEGGREHLVIGDTDSTLPPVTGAHYL